MESYKKNKEYEFIERVYTSYLKYEVAQGL